jgi:hypothetical protein
MLLVIGYRFVNDVLIEYSKYDSEH